jgi:hypothetical protein
LRRFFKSGCVADRSLDKRCNSIAEGPVFDGCGDQIDQHILVPQSQLVVQIVDDLFVEATLLLERPVAYQCELDEDLVRRPINPEWKLVVSCSVITWNRSPGGAFRISTMA